MTRLEWFNGQAPDVQDKFKNNCNTLNSGVEFFEHWVNTNTTPGLGGAFVYLASEEGHEYWRSINDELLKAQGYGE